MNSRDFNYGLIIGIIATVVGMNLFSFLCEDVERKAYSDRLVIRYYNKMNEYDNSIVVDMIKSSGIQTNFSNREFSIGAHDVVYRLSNPMKRK